MQRNRMVYAFLFLVCLHVVLCFYFVVTPSHDPFQKSAIGKGFSSLFLPGPFFGEDRIRTTMIFQVRYKTMGSWSPYSTPGQDLMNDYFAHPWMYNNIRREHFLNSVLRTLYREVPRDSARSFDAIRQAGSFCRVVRLVEQETGAVINADSVQWLYVSSSFRDRQKTAGNDSLWNFTFHPSVVCKP